MIMRKLVVSRCGKIRIDGIRTVEEVALLEAEVTNAGDEAK